MWEIVQEYWRPALEILILTLGIYFALRAIKGTRGAPVVTGFVVLLLALTLVTHALQLEVLKRLLGNFFGFIVLAILILFQPELRRMLAELGNFSLVTTEHEQRENIEVLIQSCERLSEIRIGALIAIERAISLHEAVESGVAVNCLVTHEMLETIFFPNNALHDGGVIIKGDQITHAACIFPLTQRQDLQKSTGTRHRAAIGLSEETDAVVLVVSEESGQISYAYKGELVRGVTLESLREFLTSQLVEPRRKRRWSDGFKTFRRETRARETALMDKPRPSKAPETVS